MRIGYARVSSQDQNPTCAFCSQPAVDSCAWPVYRFVKATYGDLAIGDRVRRAHDKTARPPAVVGDIEPLPNEFVKIGLVIGKRYKPIQVRSTSPLQVERAVRCGAPVCESHLRQVDDRIVYCADDWRAWQGIA